MTVRKDPSVIHNRWHDAQRVDKIDMDVEQNRNVDTDAANVQNHFGSGVLLENPQQRVLFDSDNLTAAQAAIEAAGNFDGIGLDAHQQPSEINLGNQLEIELTGSNVIGRLSVKVAVIGLSFDNELQMDRLYFYKNEKQVTSKHYKRILTVFFNDFKGSNNCSRNLGGRAVIRQASSFQLSRDGIMAAQDVSPDIFWRDFKVSDSTISLFDTIQNGIGPEFNADALQINITGTSDRELVPSDVTSQVGQKFQATTDNLQKVTLLLGVRRDDLAGEDDRFDWAGDLVISIYPLQTSTSCPTDIVPELAIDFDPSNQPLAQISYSQTSLREIGYILTDVLQPVDFVFSSTLLGSPATSKIVPNRFYTVTAKRSGAATSGTIFLGVGNDRVERSRLTVFGGVWADVSEEDLWFQVWTDSAQIADGSGYDEGNGIQFDKTTTDPSTGGTIDNQIRFKPFADTGENVLNIGVLQAIEEESVTVQNERTGNNVFSRKEFVPSFSFVDEIGLNDLQSVSSPLIIGCTQDINPKQNPETEKSQTIPGLAKGDQFSVLNPDADLLSLNLIGSKLVPNVSCSEIDYRIFKAELCTDGYGDVNGDGYIDVNDIAAASNLIGESLFFNSTQQKIVDGDINTLELLRADVNGDGYVTSADVDLITQFVNRQINSFPAGDTFTHLTLTVQQSTGRYDGYFDCDGYVRLDGYLGKNIVDPGSLSAADLLYDGYLVDPVIESDVVFTTVPFPGVTYKVTPQPYWQPHFLVFSSETRIVPQTFCDANGINASSCAIISEICQDRSDVVPECDPGRLDFLAPDNLIIGRGEILRPDGSNYKVDFEIGTVILQLPQIPFEESILNIFDKFVADRGDGTTRGGFPAMRYSDCTTVQDEDLALNRVRFSVSIQAFVPNLDGYSEADGYGVIVDDIIGVHLDPLTGILKLTIQDLFVDPVFMTLVTKIQVVAYLKKAGWVNGVVTVRPSEIAGLLST
jgi:hypothetical protein